MQTQRVAGFAPGTRALAEELTPLYGRCIGCKDCAGICHALLDVMRLPDLVLKGAPT